MGQIRDATEQDTEAIVELTGRAWRLAYPGIVPTELIEDLPLDTWRENVFARLQSPEADSFTRVVELEEGLVAYCSVAAPGRDEPDGSRIAEVAAIYVDPDWWGRGVGRALMKNVEQQVRDAGYEEITLWSFERNAQARAFYARLGWTRDGERRPHEATGIETIQLRRSLQPAE